MNIFLAGLYASSFSQHGRIYRQLTPREQEARDSVLYHLESYHYINKESAVRMLRRDEKKVFLDSGAFSAMTKGVTIDIGAYCNYIQRNKDIIRQEDDALCASVLDAIGDADGTLENQKEMERQGVKPLPCFHYNENPKFLEYYANNYSYITLGGMVPVPNPQLKLWLDGIWEKYLTDGAGRPKTKVHGFGLTSLKLTQEYPWHSVDSSTWVMNAANGFILIPALKRNVNISVLSPSRKQARQHIDTVSDTEKAYIENIITYYGFDPDRLRNTYMSRWAWNVESFPAFFKLYPPVTSFKPKQPTLF